MPLFLARVYVQGGWTGKGVASTGPPTSGQCNFHQRGAKVMQLTDRRRRGSEDGREGEERERSSGGDSS